MTTAAAGGYLKPSLGVTALTVVVMSEDFWIKSGAARFLLTKAEFNFDHVDVLNRVAQYAGYENNISATGADRPT